MGHKKTKKQCMMNDLKGFCKHYVIVDGIFCVNIVHNSATEYSNDMDSHTFGQHWDKTLLWTKKLTFSQRRKPILNGPYFEPKDYLNRAILNIINGNTFRI